MFWCIPAALQLHYATLQSLALDQTEEPPPVEDKTMPRNKQIKDVSGIADVNFFQKLIQLRQRLGHTILALKEILPSPEEEAVTQSGYKRTVRTTGPFSGNTRLADN